MGNPYVQAAYRTVDWGPQDTVVLCSDGLSDLLRPAEIKQVVQQRSARAATRALIRRANHYGGHDNISALVVRNGKLPLITRWGLPRLLGGALAALMLALLVSWGAPVLFDAGAASGGPSRSGASFNSRLVEVPIVNPTTGLVELVMVTTMPTPESQAPASAAS